jgi:hypothetical protein
MGKHFDELSKALASGASRRSALKRFAAGVAGAAIASFLPGRRAEAQTADELRECQEICRELGLQGGAFGQCMAQCTTCVARGDVFVILNSGPVCI